MTRKTPQTGGENFASVFSAQKSGESVVDGKKNPVKLLESGLSPLLTKVPFAVKIPGAKSRIFGH